MSIKNSIKYKIKIKIIKAPKKADAFDPKCFFIHLGYIGKKTRAVAKLLLLRVVLGINTRDRIFGVQKNIIKKYIKNMFYFLFPFVKAVSKVSIISSSFFHLGVKICASRLAI